MKNSNMLKSLLDEAFGAGRRRRMSWSSRIIWAIILLPITISYLWTLAYFFLIDFWLNGLAAPYNAYHQFIKNERSEVRPATEVIIYVLAFPFLVAYHVFVATSNCLLYALWFCIMVFTYVLTLGGVRWQPFIMNAKFGDIDENETPSTKYEPEEIKVQSAATSDDVPTSEKPAAGAVTAHECNEPTAASEPLKEEAQSAPKKKGKSLTAAQTAEQKKKQKSLKAEAIKNFKSGYATHVELNEEGVAVCPICEKSLSAEPDSLLLCPECHCIIKTIKHENYED